MPVDVLVSKKHGASQKYPTRAEISRGILLWITGIAPEWRQLAEMDLNSAGYLLNWKLSAIIKPLKNILKLSCSKNKPAENPCLSELLKLCLSFSDAFQDIADECSDLTAFGVQPRYPMELVLEEQDVRQALSSAKVVRNFLLKLAPEMFPRI